MFVPHVNAPEDLLTVAGRWILVDSQQRVVLHDGAFPVQPDSPLPSESVHFLGFDDDVPVWAASVADESGGERLHIRALYGSIPEADWVLAGRAAQVITWERDHSFCGRCGDRTEQHSTDRARVCESCEYTAFPRISPAVIMLVERQGLRGPEVLLAWGRQFPGRFFSALAGFVEPGESLEECVVREVREETSIEVNDVRFFGSQPWPFPHSLMVGFNASYSSGEIQIQEEEIVEAGWFGPNELPPVPRGGMSIAGWLLEDWLRRIA